MIGGIVLAAGAGTRFGGGKQLALLDGRPLLEHAVRGMTSAPVGRVIVVLGAEAEHVLARVDLHGAEPVVCERWSEGQSASLACGLGEMADCEAVVVTLGDQPRVEPQGEHPERLDDAERVIGEVERAVAVRAVREGPHQARFDHALYDGAAFGLM